MPLMGESVLSQHSSNKTWKDYFTVIRKRQNKMSLNRGLLPPSLEVPNALMGIAHKLLQSIPKQH